MRIFVGVGLLLLCPVLAGCSLFRDKRGDTARVDGASGPRPFTGSPASPLPDRTDREGPTAAQVAYSGVLAGTILDGFNRPMTGAFVQVVDLTDPDSKVKLDVAVLPPRGEFVITRLVPGHNYKLIARVMDGTRLLAGSAQATAPKPNIAIYVSEEFVGPDTPPLPGPITMPGRKPEPEEKEKDKTPPAGLGAPIKEKSDPAAPIDPATRLAPPVVVPGGPGDKTNVAQSEEGGFRRVKPDAPRVDVPGPKPSEVIPPPPPPPRITMPPAVEEKPPPPPKPETDPKTNTDAVLGTATPTPSCVLVGKKLENFALFDLNGKPWEFKKDHKGKLVLLHFWSSTSPECLAGLKDLRDLQAKFDSFGLEVVSIAYEQGPWVEQVRNVNSARGRYTLFKFVSLLGGGGPGSCPVRDQFVISQLPELVLIGEDGQIVWRGTAPDADRLAGLRIEIKNRLHVSE